MPFNADIEFEVSRGHPPSNTDIEFDVLRDVHLLVLTVG